MEETVKQRLVKFLKYKELSQKRFEEAVGLSNGYINSLRKSPSATKLQMILGTYPELNQHWLLTGEGEMLVPQGGNLATVVGDGTAVAGNSNHVEVPTIISKALDEIAAQRMITQTSQQQISKSQEQLDKAFAQVAIAQEQINRLITLLEKQHQ
jgi:transcriptional regulator with XRE-family HTH domain